MSKSPCNAKHTPGPWIAVKLDDPYRWNVDAPSEPVFPTVARMGLVDPSPLTVEANARLIAAAPDLLRELKSVLFFIESFKDHEETLAAHEVFSRFAEAGNWEQVQAIIAKAEGSSNV